MRKLTIADFWGRVRKDGPVHPVLGTACWLYEGPRLRRSGYGYAGDRYAHRIAYEECVGPIPEGLEVDHLCSVRHCVNPAHLEAVTHQINILRSENFAGRLARQTHCVNGHKFTPANTWRRKEGWRQCKACNNDRAKAHYARAQQ